MNIMLSITAGFIGSKRRCDSRQTIPIKWRICPQVQGWDNGGLALRHSQRTIRTAQLRPLLAL
ncbi:MAG: hypothetical protein WAL37_19295, partial [Xanthobacteraceae bacterium]